MDIMILLVLDLLVHLTVLAANRLTRNKQK
jgi:hypothetical protein